MTFRSIMFPDTQMSPHGLLQEAPAYFKDLNLDQIVDAITKGKEEYNLKPFFFTTLHDEDTIIYRQEVMQDLEREIVFKEIRAFTKTIYQVATRVQKISENLADPESYNYNYLEKGRLLDSAGVYCQAIDSFVSNMASIELKSRGLSAFMEYITNYARSDAYTTLRSETNAIKAELSTVRYCMLIKGNCIKVRKYEGEMEYTSEIERIFEKFRQGTVKDYRKKLLEEPYAEHVEAGVLNLVARLYPDIFSKLDNFCTKHRDFIDETIFVFAREIQFYIAYLEYIEKFKREGLCFCYPQITVRCKEIHNFEGFDLALADKLIRQNKAIVCNDFYLKGKERIIVVSGPNQGGKTTFARVFGQLHHFASLGCPVPGKEAKLFLFDQIYTHFEREEDIKNLRGKLEDDLIRMKEILDHATPNSIIIINEFLSSTALKDAIAIGKKIMDKLVKLDALCVWVTFLDELASYSEKNVSMVSTVMPEDPTRRTYKIIRSPADGLAYAIHIAEKYRLTYNSLKERIKDESAFNV